MDAVTLPGTPLPHLLARVPAPASPQLPALAGPAASEPGGAAAGALPVPGEFLRRLRQAMREGAADARAFASEHAPAERWMIPDWALLRMKWPPRDDAKELAYLHAVARTRTPAGIAAARHWGSHGLTDEWERRLEDYTRGASPQQARAARKLLHDALMMVNTITQTAKAGAARKRPFTVDPTLPLAVERPGNNPSYPSGHTTAAYAACLVLAHLMPDRRAEFLGVAHEASWARVYSGVHFPSDVVAGAKLATTVASYLVGLSTAQPRRGTSSTNPGIAGARIAAAPTLPGPSLTAAAVMPAGQAAGDHRGASDAGAAPR